jgi:hypothetical protein
MAIDALRGSRRHEFDDTADDRSSTVDSRPFGGTCSLANRADVSKLPRLGENHADSGRSVRSVLQRAGPWTRASCEPPLVLTPAAEPQSSVSPRPCASSAAWMMPSALGPTPCSWASSERGTPASSRSVV